MYIIVDDRDIVAGGYANGFDREGVSSAGTRRLHDHHPPKCSPGNNPKVGKITSASDYGYNPSERIIQFGLKYNF